MTPKGGTEILVENLIKHTGLDWTKYINLIPSTCDVNLLDPNRKNVIWQHLSYDQGACQLTQDVNFVNMVDHFVYVSEWQLTQYLDKFPIHDADNRIMRNAIDPINYIEKPKDKIQLIYTSMPFRGLDVLLDSFELLKRDDVELVIYSSNIIYGKGYSTGVGEAFTKMFHRAKMMKNVIYKGYAMNQAVRKAVQQAHILAYPSTFEETSCLAAIEAGAAGCKIVTTDLGALRETCGDHAILVEYTDDRIELAHRYAEILNQTIDNYEHNSYNLKDQSVWFNDRYSWHNRADECKGFFKEICAK